MTMTLPSGRSGQIISVLLLILLVTAAWRLLAMPLIDFYDARRQDLEDRAMQAAHLTALADALPRLKESLNESDPAPVMTVTGATDSVAAASLQGAVQDMVNDAGASLGSIEIMPSSESAEGLRRIGLKVTLSGDLKTITRLLAAIDHAVPPTLIDELQIHGNAVRGASNGAEPPVDAQRLDVSFAVYGFRLDQPEGGRP